MIAIHETPIEHLCPSGGGVSQRVGENLWIKRDDLTHARYGGNKARKLSRILPDAAQRGARRIVTLGAVGSHHVLATTLFASEQGLAVAAVLTPQPRTDHAVDVLRAALGAGVQAHAAGSPAEAVAVLARVARRGDVVLPLGGSSARGVEGYADAAREIAGAVWRGDAPHPDVVVVAAGSGGTAAGLALGFARLRFVTRVLAIPVVDPPAFARMATRALIAQAAFRAPTIARRALASLDFDNRWVGVGYGVPTAAGLDAIAEANARGLVCDATYTGKALAAAMALSLTGKTVLYVHTLSSAPMDQRVMAGPRETDLPPGLRRLLT